MVKKWAGDGHPGLDPGQVAGINNRPERLRLPSGQKGLCILMGIGQGYQKRTGFTKRCAWCGLIKLAGAWMHERRVPPGENYTHGICEPCRDKFLAEAAADR